MKNVRAWAIQCRMGVSIDRGFGEAQVVNGAPPLTLVPSCQTGPPYLVSMTRYPTPASHIHAPPILQVPGWVPGEPTTRHRWLPPLESWAKRSLI